MDSVNRRRALFAGAGFATAVPSLVRADSLLDIPGDPLSKRGLFAAERYASDLAGEYPGCRLAFSNGETFSWMFYTSFHRSEAQKPPHAYAVAIEVITTDERGKRFITSIPVDGAKLHRDNMNAIQRQREIMAKAHLNRTKWEREFMAKTWGSLEF